MSEDILPAFIVVPDREDCVPVVEQFQQGKINVDELVNMRQIKPELDLVETFRLQALL